MKTSAPDFSNADAFKGLEKNRVLSCQVLSYLVEPGHVSSRPVMSCLAASHPAPDNPFISHHTPIIKLRTTRNKTPVLIYQNQTRALPGGLENEPLLRGLRVHCLPTTEVRRQYSPHGVASGSEDSHRCPYRERGAGQYRISCRHADFNPGPAGLGSPPQWPTSIGLADGRQNKQKCQKWNNQFSHRLPPC